MSMRATALIVVPIPLMALAILGTPLAGEPQQAAKGPRIGFLSASSQSAEASRVQAFRQGLRELGYIEGENIIIEYRWAEGKVDRLSSLATELIRLKVHVVVVAGDAAIRAAKSATGTIPIVMSTVGDPVGSGLVASLGRPGGNITGLSVLSPELSGKALELLKETLPKVSRVAILWNPANASKILDFKAAQVAAKALGVQLQSLEVRADNDFDPAFRAAIQGKPDALSVRADSFTLFHRKRIVDFALKSRLPAIYELREYVDAGGLMSYGPSREDLHRRAANYVDRILKGASPADLPVEQPTKFELVINLKTAKALGLMIPPSLLLRADQVFE